MFSNIGINYNLYSNKVDYIDENTFHGEMGIFKKLSSYKHQSEHRIVVDKNINNDTLTLNIGSIQDISKIYSSKDILNTLKLQKSQNQPKSLYIRPTELQNE